MNIFLESTGNIFKLSACQCVDSPYKQYVCIMLGHQG